MKDKSQEIKIQFLSNLLAQCQKLGVSRNLLIADDRFASGQLSRKEIEDLWKKAVTLTGAENLGLKVGAAGNLSSIGVVGSLIQNSKTIREGLSNATEFMRLVTDAFTMELKEGRKNFSLIFHPAPSCESEYPISLRHSIDSAIVFSYFETRWLGLKPVTPIKVKLKYPKPKYSNEFKEVFPCPILFNQDEYSITFEKKLLDEEIDKADYSILNIFLTIATEKIQALNSNTWEHAVEEILVQYNNLEFPSLPRVASILIVSERQLQRKLRSEKTTFQNILERVRRDFAVEYLMHPEPQITDIAYMLGYEEASAFTRSFRRWTGMAPSQFRQKEIK